MIDYAIFIQARLGSTRFPKKVLHELAGKRVLDHVLESCQATGLKIFLLTPESEKNFFSDNFNVEVVGGSEQDVLSRFVNCAQQNNVKNIVRITSDCPCLPTSHIEAVIQEHKNNQDSFVSNVAYHEGTYKSLSNIPDGFDVEIFSRELLELAGNNAINKHDREHVTLWMRKNCKTYIPSMYLFLEGKFSFDNENDLKRLEPNFEVLRSLKTLY